MLRAVKLAIAAACTMARLLSLWRDRLSLVL